MGTAVSGETAGRLRICGVGRATADALLRARPGGGETVLLLRLIRRVRVWLGDQGALRTCRGSAPPERRDGGAPSRRRIRRHDSHALLGHRAVAARPFAGDFAVAT